jgi:predicted deacylase
MNEHAEIHIADVSYQAYIWQLLSAAHHHHAEVEIIGHETSERTGMIYPLYRLVINPQLQPSICIVAGIHGNEIAGPLSIIQLLETFLELLPARYRYIIYPLINPTGFDLRQRYDDDDRDLNAIYQETLTSKNYTEVQAFYEDILKFGKFEAVLSLHEDSDLEQFYMYGLGKENKEFYRAICQFARTWIPTWANADIYGCHSDEFGLVLSTARDHAFDGALYHQGIAPIAFTLETPGRLDVSFRVNLMSQLVLHSLRMLDARRWMDFPIGSAFPDRERYGSEKQA